MLHYSTNLKLRPNAMFGSFLVKVLRMLSDWLRYAGKRFACSPFGLRCFSVEFFGGMGVGRTQKFKVKLGNWVPSTVLV